MLLMVPSEQRRAVGTKKSLHLNVKTWWSAEITANFPTATGRKIRLSRPLVAVDGRTDKGFTQWLHVTANQSKLLFFLFFSWIYIVFLKMLKDFEIFLPHWLSLVVKILLWQLYFCWNFCTVLPNGPDPASPHSCSPVAPSLESLSLWIDLLCHRWKNATWLWVRGEETRAFICSQSEKALFWVQKELLEDNYFQKELIIKTTIGVWSGVSLSFGITVFILFYPYFI